MELRLRQMGEATRLVFLFLRVPHRLFVNQRSGVATCPSLRGRGVGDTSSDEADHVLGRGGWHGLSGWSPGRRFLKPLSNPHTLQ